MSARDELARDIELSTDAWEHPVYTKSADALAEALRSKGYRKIFDGDCGLSGVEDPSDREASEAWMRWANLAMNEDIGAIYAMKKMLTELGYRKPRTIPDVHLCQGSDGSYPTDHKAGTIIQSADGSVWRFDEGDWDCLDWASASLRGPATVLFDPAVTL